MSLAIESSNDISDGPADALGCRVSRKSLTGLFLLGIGLLCFQFQATAGTQQGQAADTPESNDNAKVDQAPAELENRPLDFKIKGVCLVGPENHPASGSTISLVLLNGLTNQPSIVATTTSDQAGRFEFDPVEAPSDMRLQMRRYFLVTDLPNHPVVATWVHGFEDPGKTRIWLPKEESRLTGRVVNEDGNPIAGAEVTRSFPPSDTLPGVPSTITNENGLFRLPRLPRIARGETIRSYIHITVRHADYPVQKFKVEKLPGSLRFTLMAGCTLTGTVESEDPAVSAANVVVTAENIESSRSIHAVTDARGRYRLVVPEGTYHVLLDDADVIAAAITEVECRNGTEQRLDPILASSGGWIEGHIVNSKTTERMSLTKKGDKIKIGLFGPSRPMSRVINPTGLAIVDTDGRYRIRVAAGDNFPYFVNTHGDRMGWDTQRKSPVVVTAGKTTTYDMLITPKLTPDEKLAKAQRVIDALPKDDEERAAAIIEEFRQLNHTLDETETWSMLVREVERIGSIAVPALCKELEATDNPRMIIRLCFSLRAIGDPSAVPALIRSLPKRLSSTGDYGMLVEDPNLALFMRLHSVSGEGHGLTFDVNQVIEEHHGTLAYLTKRSVDTVTLYSMRRSDDRRNLARQQEYYHNAATHWAAWWEAHWQEFDVDPSLQNVDLPAWNAPDLGNYPTGLRITANAKLSGGSIGLVLTPVGDQGIGATFFKDLDTGNKPRWPKDLPANDESPETVAAVRKWAADHGIDLMCVTGTDDDGNVTYTLHGIDLQLWEIDPLDAENIDKRIASGTLPAGRKLDTAALLHFDRKSGTLVNQHGTSFLYVTRDEGLGLITITDYVVAARDVTGQLMTEPGIGFHRGVRFNLNTIAR